MCLGACDLLQSKCYPTLTQHWRNARGTPTPATLRPFALLQALKEPTPTATRLNQDLAHASQHKFRLNLACDGAGTGGPKGGLP